MCLLSGGKKGEFNRRGDRPPLESFGERCAGRASIGSAMRMPLTQEPAAIAFGHGEQIGASQPPACAETATQNPFGDAFGLVTVPSHVNQITKCVAKPSKADTDRHVTEKILVDFEFIGPITIAFRIHESETQLDE